MLDFTYIHFIELWFFLCNNTTHCLLFYLKYQFPSALPDFYSKFKFTLLFLTSRVLLYFICVNLIQKIKKKCMMALSIEEFHRTRFMLYYFNF